MAELTLIPDGWTGPKQRCVQFYAVKKNVHPVPKNTGGGQEGRTYHTRHLQRPEKHPLRASFARALHAGVCEFLRSPRVATGSISPEFARSAARPRVVITPHPQKNSHRIAVMDAPGKLSVQWAMIPEVRAVGWVGRPSPRNGR